MHKYSIVTPPAIEPVTVEEIQTHAIVSGEATYLSSLITTVRTGVERYLQRALITQTWKAFYDCWKYKIEMPFPPAQSVTHVKYYDLDGVQQTLSSSLYWFVNTTDPARIVRKYETTWPELQYGKPDAIEIQFVAGYGNNASNVPDPIKHAIKLWVTDLYEHRGTIVIGGIGSVNKIPGYVTDLIHSYKIYHF